MTEVIRCPHFEVALEKKQQLLGLVTNDGGYAEVCSDCVAALLDEVVADMSSAALTEALKRALEDN